MASTYVNDLRLEEMATGDQSGTWGDTTNTNLELIAEAFSYGTEASFGSDADATTTIADGATDPARSLYLKITSGVSLTATRTLTIAPNTVSKVWIIENATSGSQSINISQGSGANVTIPNGDVKVIYTDGAGSGAAVVDAFASLNVGDLTATNLAGTLSTAAQTNITSVGTLTGITTNGTTPALFYGNQQTITSLQGLAIYNNQSGGFLDTTLVYGNSTNSYLAFGHHNGTSYSERMRIDSSGNVGIGTDSPSTNLHIQSTSEPAITLFHTAVQVAQIGLDSSGSLTFGIDGSTGATERMKINTSGDVGIGTSSPSTKLDVVGSGKFQPTIAGGDALVTIAQTNANAYVHAGVKINAGNTNPFYIYQSGSSNTLRFNYNSLSDAGGQMVITDGGDVGIGNSTPLGKLTISNAAGANAPTTVTAANTYLQLGSDDYGASNNGKFMIGFGYTDATNTNSPAYIGYEETSSSGDTKGELTFYTRDVITDTAPTERMRIDSSGNLLVGKTSTTFSVDGFIARNNGFSTSRTSGTVADINRNGTDGNVFAFYKAASSVGSISVTSSATAFNTSSDYRLKENVDYTWDATTRLKQLKPARFNFIADADKTVDGFLAHEVQDIVPEAITGEKDAVKEEEYEITPAVLDDDGNVVTEAVMGTREVPDYQGIDQSKLVPLLVKTIQELEARITALES